MKMVVYNKAQDQLNNYYRSLHENERFLSAVKIVEYITRENRDNACEHHTKTDVQSSRKAALICFRKILYKHMTKMALNYDI